MRGPATHTWSDVLSPTRPPALSTRRATARSQRRTAAGLATTHVRAGSHRVRLLHSPPAVPVCHPYRARAAFVVRPSAAPVSAHGAPDRRSAITTQPVTSSTASPQFRTTMLSAGRGLPGPLPGSPASPLVPDLGVLVPPVRRFGPPEVDGRRDQLGRTSSPKPLALGCPPRSAAAACPYIPRETVGARAGPRVSRAACWARARCRAVTRSRGDLDRAPTEVFTRWPGHPDRSGQQSPAACARNTRSPRPTCRGTDIPTRCGSSRRPPSSPA